MHDDAVLILKGHEIGALLSGREEAIVETVRRAYEAHARGRSSLPHSVFLGFGEGRRERIIALPAYLADEGGGAGLKWVSSFPQNLEKGLDRASAVIILNAVETGRPEALMEGSIISAKRTAASAALAARTLSEGRAPDSVALVGCGLINFETLRFLRSGFEGVSELYLYDTDRARAEQFEARCAVTFGGLRTRIVKDTRAALAASPLVSFATTAVVPHVSDLSAAANGSVILHISLRDLTPEVILGCDNVVDDVDHVCRAQTSVHLAEKLTGSRDFIRCALGDILTGAAPARASEDRVTVFSPFGLGILDVALSRFAYDSAVKGGVGTWIDSFLPEAWNKEVGL